MNASTATAAAIPPVPAASGSVNDNQPGAAPAQQSLIDRKLGPVGGAATKGGIGVTGITTLLTYIFECLDKHHMLHPDAATTGVLSLCLIAAWDEIRVMIANSGKHRRRGSDPGSNSDGSQVSSKRRKSMSLRAWLSGLLASSIAQEAIAKGKAFLEALEPDAKLVAVDALKEGVSAYDAAPEGSDKVAAVHAAVDKVIADNKPELETDGLKALAVAIAAEPPVAEKDMPAVVAVAEPTAEPAAEAEPAQQ